MGLLRRAIWLRRLWLYRGRPKHASEDPENAPQQREELLAERRALLERQAAELMRAAR